QARRKQAEHEELETDQKRYQKFARLRDKALILDTHFTGLDSLGNAAETRRTAGDALAVFTDPGSGERQGLPVVPPSLSQHEDEVLEGCYMLLWARAETEERPDDGLQVLDQAARLRREPTRAYHLRRAACLRLKGDAEGAMRVHREADLLRPSTA